MSVFADMAVLWLNARDSRKALEEDLGKVLAQLSQIAGAAEAWKDDRWAPWVEEVRALLVPIPLLPLEEGTDGKVEEKTPEATT